jgi:hypothetical protein
MSANSKKYWGGTCAASVPRSKNSPERNEQKDFLTSGTLLLLVAGMLTPLFLNKTADYKPMYRLKDTTPRTGMNLQLKALGLTYGV